MTATATMGDRSRSTQSAGRQIVPQAIWLILLALAIGLISGLDAPTLITKFGKGFGSALGSFALILIPSFVLAACLARHTLRRAPRVASAIAPVTAAGMVCPDTAYVALSSIAGKHKLSVAFGSYAGYRLLFPAGPLIVATGLGLDSAGLVAAGLALLIPVWLTGELWARYRGGLHLLATASDDAADQHSPLELVRALAPLIVLAGMLVVGAVLKPVDIPLLDFITRPKGALIVAAALAISMIKADERKPAFDAAIARSASLLLVIGAASAFGAMLASVLPIDRMMPHSATGTGLLVGLFVGAAVFKVAYGSSTVALATATSVLAPVLMPLVNSNAISGVPAVLAICLGSMVIVPTDSYYWLVRNDALSAVGERSAVVTLGGGAVLQGLAGLAVLVFLAQLQWI